MGRDDVERQSFVRHKFEQRQWRVKNCIAMKEKSVNLNSIFQVFNSELNQIIFLTCYQVPGYWLFCFRRKVSLLIPYFYPCCPSMPFLNFGHLQQGWHCCRKRKTTQSLCSSHSLSSKSSLQYFVVFHNISHRLMWNLMHKRCSVKSAVA